MAIPPTGTVTFLFTDIEGSTAMWERSPQAMQAALARHDELLRRAIEERGGYVFKTVGDAFCAAFSTASDALEAALDAQRLLLEERWAESTPLRVRMALHMGAAQERDGDYFGPPVNRVARLLSAAHGGQVLLSLSTQELVRDLLPAGTSLRDLGEHRLKDLFRPERVFQLTAPELPSEYPPLRTLDAYRNNLHLQPTPLIGREKEVSEVSDLLRGGETRLLTLTGPGGTGKTRLALQAAADLLDDFSDGTFFVPLATVSEAELFLPAVAEALGLREIGEQPLGESLKDYLGERRLLLVLDNFEQVLGAAPAVTELLAEAPGLKVLATSRTPLRLYGEKEYAVPPLSVPDLRHLPDLNTLSQYEAVRLFIERAKAAKADFSITNESVPAVAEICVRLDGLPLAIELAAARIKMLPPKALLHRLDSRLKLLTGGARDLPERQRTLRATIEWSFALLEEGEQLLFARLAVFSGGRTLQAIEAICDTRGELPVDAFEGISSLLDKSLLRQEEGLDDEPRFVMLETVHEFAREKLGQSPGAEEIRRLHAAFFLALAEEADSELGGPQQGAWLERLETEHDNMRAALTWSVEVRDVEVALRLAGALAWFWGVRGHYTEGRRWLEELLAKGSEASIAAQAKALFGAGRLMELYGDYKQAEIAINEGLRLYQDLADSMGIARSRSYLGWITLAQGDLERAKTFTEGLAQSPELVDSDISARGLETLGWLAWDQGDVEQGKSLLEESLRISRESGDAGGILYGLINLGFAAMLQGDYEQATTLTEEGLTLSRQLDDQPGIVLLLCNLGTIAQEQGDHDRAAELFKESIKRNRKLGNKAILAELMEGIAGVAGAHGSALRAARLYGAAEVLREAISVPVPAGDRPRYERHIAVACSVGDEETWEKAWAEGKNMALEQAVEYALSEEEHIAPTLSARKQPSVDNLPSGLTRREREVAKLVAQGLTNRQIAEALFVSERTVDHHVSNILKKLSLSSREQVASRLGDN